MAAILRTNPFQFLIPYNPITAARNVTSDRTRRNSNELIVEKTELVKPVNEISKQKPKHKRENTKDHTFIFSCKIHPQCSL